MSPVSWFTNHQSTDGPRPTDGSDRPLARNIYISILAYLKPTLLNEKFNPCCVIYSICLYEKNHAPVTAF